jgi:uncharacterized protein (TIRG00374 family)
VADFIQEEPHQPSFPLDLARHRFAIYGGIAVILGPVTLWFLRRLLPGQPILLPLRSINFVPLLIALVLLMISWLARLLRIWCLIQPSADSIAPKDFIKSYLAGAFISHVTPSAAGGYPFFLLLLHQQGIPAGKSLAVSLIDSVNTGLTIGSLLAIGTLLLHIHVSTTDNWLAAAVIGIMFLSIPALTLLVFAGKISQAASRLSRKHPDPSNRIALLAARAAGEIQRFESAVSTFWRHHRQLLFANLLFNLIYWVSFLSITPMLLRAVGGRAPWPIMVGSHIATQFDPQPDVP